MPNYITLKRKSNTAAGPVSFQEIDDEMRVHFKAPASQDKFYKQWYDTIAFALALGHNWPKIKEFFPDRADIIDWLAENYTTDAWYQPKGYD